MSMMDRFSPAVFPFGRRPPTLDEIVKATQHAEKLGFYSVNIPLQNAIFDAGPFAKFGNKYILDALALLPAMVAATSKVRIAVDAIPLPMLPPFEWAKYFASLDVISGGRIIVGMCLGMGDEAFATVGANPRKRGKVSDEQAEIITRLWTEDSVTYDGEFYQLEDVRLEPKPVQKPYPPIWWAGRTPSIPRAARYAEVIDPPWPTIAEIENEYLPGLAREGEKWGRSVKLGGWFYTHITPDKPMSEDEINEYFGDMMSMEIAVVPADITISGSPERCAAKIRAYLDAGLEHFVLDFQRHGVDPTETLMEQMDLLVDKVVPLL